MAADREPQDDDGGEFTHHVVPAHLAAPAKTRAPNSVFALGAAGGAAPAAAAAPAAEPASAPATSARPTARRPRMTRAAAKEAVLQLLRAQGELDSQQLSEQMDLHVKGVQKTMTALQKAGQVRWRRDGNRWLYRAVAESGQSRVIMSRPAAPQPAAVAPVPQAPAAPTPVVCGLFSSGEVSIEANGQQLRLVASQARQLINWLSLVDAVLAAE